MTEPTGDKHAVALAAMGDPNLLSELVSNLGSSSRRLRQNSASAITEVANADANLLADHISSIAAALSRHEAQTRWECLDALTLLVDVDSRACEKAIVGADAALFDEGPGTLHLSAMRFLCKLGATTQKRSEKTWDYIDEAIQCYHGDPEFYEMLNAVIGFSKGALAPSVKRGLKERMVFDAENAKGLLQRRAQEIIDNLA